MPRYEDPGRSRDEIVSENYDAEGYNNWYAGFQKQNALIIELLLDIRDNLNRIFDKIPNS